MWEGGKKKSLILSSARLSKCPRKLLLPLVILKDSSMTLEVDTREKDLDTLSHTLQCQPKAAKPHEPRWFVYKKKRKKKSLFMWRKRPSEAAHLCRMRPLMGRRASYTVRASLTQSVGSMRSEATVRRIRNPGAVASFTWQLRPPQEEKTFNGTVAPGRLA